MILSSEGTKKIPCLLTDKGFFIIIRLNYQQTLASTQIAP
ncbi:hypothetical protein HMPREF3226_00230 [Prevotella corporis]|uniref:Uncharacterized protein n=1 Tax=Prevotella corporis TaxID=28128 RepID=A0A133QNF1_9BACT|nr:hypothetical protein HMPREF3226_00230 [Prevotella corporis]